MKYAVLGEYQSDSDTLKVLIERLAKRLLPKDQADRLFVKAKGYHGAGELFADGARDLSAFAELQYERFVVCHDADEDSWEERSQKVLDRIIKPSAINVEACCIVIPVREIEAWILADLNAVRKVFTSWKLVKELKNTEKIAKPKERLEAIVKDQKTHKGLYDHVRHNDKVAKYLCFECVARKCPSFKCFVESVIPRKQQQRARKRVNRKPRRRRHG